MIEELRHCPFCGGEGTVLHETDSGRVAVLCQDCHSITEPQTSGTIHDRIKRAIARWNMRPTKGDWVVFFSILGPMLINVLGLGLGIVKQADIQKAVCVGEGLIGFNIFWFGLLAWAALGTHFDNRARQEEAGM